MFRGLRTRVLRRNLGFLLLLAVTACAREPAAVTPSAFEGIALTNQDGLGLGPSDLAGKVLLVNFMFTSCSMVCPRQTRALLEIRNALPTAVRAEVRFLSVSVDPENDEPDALKRFARAHGADLPGWSFVRADEAGTERLARRMAVFDASADAATGPAAHTTALYLFDKKGALAQRYSGSPIDVPRLSREVAALQMLR
jgi:protein SCO1/2